jgi:hypothetical protein
LPGTELGRIDLRPETVEALVARHEDALLRSLDSTGNVASSMSAMMAFGGTDRRSKDEYREEVRKFCDAFEARLPAFLAARSVLHDIGLLELEVVSRAETPFTGVRVELWFPDFVQVFASQREAGRVELPERPAPYGKPPSSYYSGLIPSLRMPDPELWLPRVQRQTDGVRVVFRDEEVRPHGAEELPELWIVLDENAPDVVQVRWEATAANANKRLTGTLDLPVAEHVATPAELSEAPPGESDD